MITFIDGGYLHCGIARFPRSPFRFLQLYRQRSLDSPVHVAVLRLYDPARNRGYSAHDLA